MHHQTVPIGGACCGNGSGRCQVWGLGLSHLITLGIGIFIGTQLIKYGCCSKKDPKTVEVPPTNVIAPEP